nr:unnamed protein product [Digitaria exilis]
MYRAKRAASLKVKRRVGKYELGRTIGEGTFAKVRFATNMETGEHVAIKIIEKARVQKHKLVEQLENLLLDMAGNLKISDFGLSAISDQVKNDGLLHTTCGTPNYVAPEVIDDKGYDGALADLWSCGVILFVLLAGYLPFEDDNIASLYKKISEAQFSCPSWFSAGSKKLITRILDPNPSTRITVSQVQKDPWFKKGYKPPVFDEKCQASLDDVDAAFGDSEELLVTEEMEGQPASMNAFELISMNEGLNLGNFFDSDKMLIENPRAGRKGNLNVATEVFQVAPSLHVVELKKAKGDTLEFQNVRSSKFCL